MNINYEAYKVFYNVANTKSISRSAEELCISQPAVSWQIKNLESQVGCTLFTRTKKGVTLTKEGEILFEYVKKGIEAFANGENILTNYKNLNVGTIRIGASTTVCRYCIMPYLEIFHKLYPNIDIQIVNTLTENLLSDLRNGNLDLLVLNMPMKEAKDLNITKLMDVHDTFVANKEYFNLTKGKINIQDLKKYPLLIQKSPSNTRAYLDNYLKEHNISIVPKMEIVSYNLIMDFASSGFGIAYATKEFVANELKTKKLYEIKVEPQVKKRYIGLITLNSSIPNYSVNKLIEIMTNKNLSNIL